MDRVNLVNISTKIYNLVENTLFKPSNKIMILLDNNVIKCVDKIERHNVNNYITIADATEYLQNSEWFDRDMKPCEDNDFYVSDRVTAMITGDIMKNILQINRG